MSKRTNKKLNPMFGRRTLRNYIPDDFWALPGELVGVEIETEDFTNSSLAAGKLAPEWVPVNDGSLRNGVEWILSGPLGGTALRTAIDKFFDGGYKYKMSERTSTHLHINMSDDIDLESMRNLFVLMYIIEPSVFRWADENRKWCGYCCPLTDISQPRLVTILNDENDDALVRAIRGDSHHERYYGLNISAFHKHGTVEFRYFPCTTDKSKVLAWIQFCMQTKRAAISFEGPDELLNNFSSADSVRAFINQQYGDNAEQILRNLDIEDSIKRAKMLQALLDVAPNEVVGARGYRNSNITSKGLNKMLKVKFKYDPEKEESAAGKSQGRAAGAALLAELRERNAALRRTVDTLARQNVNRSTISGWRSSLSALNGSLAVAEELTGPVQEAHLAHADNVMTTILNQISQVERSQTTFDQQRYVAQMTARLAGTSTSPAPTRFSDINRAARSAANAAATQWISTDTFNPTEDR